MFSNAVLLYYYYYIVSLLFIGDRELIVWLYSVHVTVKAMHANVALIEYYKSMHAHILHEELQLQALEDP